MRAAALVLAAALLAPAAAAAQAPVRIGVVAPMTGPLGIYGRMMEEAARSAAAALDATGGIGGAPIEILARDDAGDPARARAAADALVREGVAAVVGHLTAQPSLEAAEVYRAAGVVMIAPAATEPRLTETPSWNVLRLAGRDDRQGVVAGRYLAAAAPDARVAIVHDKSAFGKGVADALRAALGESRLAEVAYEGIDPGQASYRGLAERLAAARPTHVYFGGLAAEAAILLRELRAAGSDATLVASDAIAAPSFAELAPEIAEGTLMTAPPDAAFDPAVTTIAGAMAAQAPAGSPPAAVAPIVAPEGVIETLHPVALNAYAAVEAFALAAREVGLDGEAVAARLRADPVETILGPILFDASGDVIAQTSMMHVWRALPLGGLDYFGAPAP